MTISPKAILWSNGNAMFLDESGKQVAEMQEHGWAGLHLFVKRWPAAPVEMGDWRSVPPFPVTSVGNVLKSLRDPDA